MNALEIAVYALVLSGGTDGFTCRTMEAATGDVVTCTNGRSALEEDGRIKFENGVSITKLPDGKLAFSNGISTHWGSAGWVQFSNGISVRRTSDGSFKSSTGMRCAQSGTTAAACRKE